MTDSTFPSIIVVGSGAAGLCACIEAARAGARVFLVTRSMYSHRTFRWEAVGGCTAKTNAFNAAVGVDDSVQSHVHDTLAGGGHAGHPGLVEALCHGALEIIPWLEELGLDFERDADGRLATRPYGGCEFPRAVYLDDRLGFYIQRSLSDELARLVNAGRVELGLGLRAHAILKDHAGAVRGLRVLDEANLQLLDLHAPAVVLAAGGGASMYAPTAVAADKTCDCSAIGLRAGAEAIDLEFVQFHPTGITSAVPTYDGALIGENVRFNGAQLLNGQGERFMFSYHPDGEQATRDAVSRGIFRELLAGRAVERGSVTLDISSCADLIVRRFPALRERLEICGYDPRTHHQLLVRPTAHFMMGGLAIDGRCATTVPGLFAAGESAGGVHGANRLGGNGLSEALVFGRIAGRAARETSAAAGDAGAFAGRIGTLPLCSEGDEHPEDVLEDLRRAMYWNAGPVRDAERLEDLRETLGSLRARASHVRRGSGARAAANVRAWIDLDHLLLVSECIVEGALRREESRGSHYRLDHPEPAAHHEQTVFAMTDGKLELSSRPICASEPEPSHTDPSHL